MKIAQLSTRYPPGPGGVERHVGEISRRLADRGNEVRVFTSDLYREYPWQRLAPDVPRVERAGQLTIRRLPVWTLPGEFHYPFFRNLGRALRGDRPEILNVHTYGTNHAAAAHRFWRSTRTPYVLTAHYHPIWSIYGGRVRHAIRRFYDRRLSGPILADAARVIVQSAEEERLIRENGHPLPKVERIPPGYSPLPAPAAGDRPFANAYRIDGPYVLFVGRLASNKGLLQLVDAFASLAESDPSARLVLVGEDGGMREAVLRRTRERRLERRVILPGFVADESLLAAGFRDARVAVLPSEYEAFGLVLLEALAQGTPVIASRVGGIPEFIEDGRAGVLVPPLDVAALAQAILSLWNDEPRRQRLGEYGRSSVVPKFSWETVVSRLEQVYREVLGN